MQIFKNSPTINSVQGEKYQLGFKYKIPLLEIQCISNLLGKSIILKGIIVL